MRRSSKLPADLNQRAFEVVRMSTEEIESSPQAKSAISSYLSQIGRKGGLKGGKSRAKKLSAVKRSEIARNAAKSRWAKQRVVD
jgi:hypothetical protein